MSDSQPVASLSLDQWADPSSCPDYLLSSMRFKQVDVKGVGRSPVPYFPMGTLFVGEDALRIVKTGQGVPANDACKSQCGLSEQEIKRRLVEYEMDSKGITEKGDRELYRAGVIKGMNPDGTAIPGPLWDEYQRALKESTEGDE